VGARVEFRGHDRGQNGALEDPEVITEPMIVFASTEAYVYAGID
jgi:hypothetical protein